MISDFLEKSSDWHIRHSKLESDRFGMSVARLNIPIDCSASDKEIAMACRKSSANLIILRFPSSRIHLAHEFIGNFRKNCFSCRHIGLFFENLRAINERLNTKESFKFVVARSNDQAKIIELTRSIFHNYPNHYQSNRALDSKMILDGYIEWALNGLNDPEKLTVIIEDQSSRVIAFALVSFERQEAEIELNGVHPDFQNRGVYSVLLESLSAYLADRKVEKLSISTQIQNTRVIRAWIKAGFSLDFSLNTFHLIARENSLQASRD